MKRLFCILSIYLSLSAAAVAQSTIVKDFKETTDSLNILLREKTDVNGWLGLKAIMKRGGTLDFYFTESLGDYPLRTGDVKWFRNQLRSLFPEKYQKYELGRVYSRNVDISRLEISGLDFNGIPSETKNKAKNPKNSDPIVERIDGMSYDKGLDGRTIAVWQSHGLYFSESIEEWIWQRPCLFQTVEDMYTQSYVLPYLVPMLENAGAYVMLPRERDIQVNEVIADNEATFGGRGKAVYREKGQWKDCGTGFADLQETYSEYQSPFCMGSVRGTECISNDAKSQEATAEWRPDIPKRGEYAVYVSYRSLPESSSAALYTVHHLGGSTRFIVNQKIGGGTWVYLGTFEFEQGSDGYVTLSNRTPKGRKSQKGKTVTADAVKFGGGMGNIARKVKDSESEAVTSGYPRSVEGARYWLQWAGADKEVYSPNELEDDYKDDYMSRGDWVSWLSGGSDMNPDQEGKGVHIDLSFGFHTDAGVTPDDSIIGTLAIYTLKSEKKEVLPGGENRMTSREFADIIQSQIVNDIRKQWNPDWNRRSVWDRGYRESRTPSCPSMLLELLSHQNFADMKYGLDPAFRFSVSRSIYKGMLKYLSRRYGTPYMVQPLPVKSMGVKFGKEGKAVISWEETVDELEPTAKSEGFILYTRIDDGGFDNGIRITPSVNKDGSYTHKVNIEKGRIYSFRIEAWNKGGRSFPSETVCIGIPEQGNPERNVLIVNNFDRISGPAFIDTPSYAGFDNRLDSGVPHIRDISYIGDMYQFRRGLEWISNDNPGFGGSYDDYAGKTVAGNTFDFAYTHGKSIMKAGSPFISCSNERFCSDTAYRKAAWSLDLICGKQVTTVVGNDSLGTRFSIFPAEMQNALMDFTAGGGNVLISGAYIGTDVWGQIYEHSIDKEAQAETQKFVRNILGYKWVRGHGSRSGKVRYVTDGSIDSCDEDDHTFHNSINPDRYCVETPDGISPSGKNSETIMRYSDTGISAAIGHQGDGYRTVCIGFPIETLKTEESIDTIISTTLDFFTK